MPPRKKTSKAHKSIPKIPYHRKPDDMSIDQWQVALRKQFAEQQQFTVKNTGGGLVFSDYYVSGSNGENTYKVAIRGAEPGWNFCSCMDFKTNQLRTCKHIEYVLLQINKNAQRKKLLKQGYTPHYTSVYLDYGTERKVKIRIGAELNTEFQELSKAFFDAENTLLPEAYDSIDLFFQKAFLLHPDFRCYPDALHFILEKREEKIRNNAIDKALEQSDTFFKGIIKTSLFPYQQQGVTFALRKSRCLIADDMGLGKTIQAIGAAEGMKKLFGISKVLIICPTSLKYQWKSEIEKFTDSSLCVVEGNIAEREKQYADESLYKICTYNVVGRDINAINKNEFDLVILDEAQRIKNWQTLTAQNVKKVQSKHCIVLTGTPLENKLEELYSVVQMVSPLHLGALFRFVSAHQITAEDTGKVIGYKDLDKIAALLQSVLLRRHKRDVLKQLPERMDKNIFVPMTPKQLDYYNEANENVIKLVNKWIRFKFLSESDRQKLLINLNLMRMACNSTFIIDQETRHDTKVDELMNILEEVMENSDEKVVVFSQWERMTRIVAQELDNRGIGYESLHGGVASKDREKLFDNFRNKPESRVFLSTDAGGVGLNLQSASLLVNLDLPWNPAVLEQRIARIHRMGQKKNVQIINLIAKETIEEQMLTKLKFKSSVAAGILDNGDSSVFLGESKFNELMKQVKGLTETTASPAMVSATDLEAAADTDPKIIIEKPKEPKVVQQTLDFFEEERKSTSAQKSSNIKNETNELLKSGSDFLGKLMHTLSDASKTEQLLNAIIKEDETTGDTYLHIPLKKDVVANGLKLLGQLLGGLGK
ncbi:MAG: DEAD/DEAH box helicase [Bacteroidetes bacterium]|nr:DEAD/DEAH box helicase [Bacteroidota bacterium]MBS1738998.1 DEAD/DEAH box helicase [Bacteroidota bacterium]